MQQATIEGNETLPKLYAKEGRDMRQAKSEK